MRIKLIGFRTHGSRPHNPPLQEPTSTGLHDLAGVLTANGHFELQVL